MVHRSYNRFKNLIVELNTMLYTVLSIMTLLSLHDNVVSQKHNSPPIKPFGCVTKYTSSTGYSVVSDIFQRTTLQRYEFILIVS